MDYRFALVRIRYSYTFYYFRPFTSIFSFRRIIKVLSVSYACFLAILCLDNLEGKKWLQFQAQGALFTSIARQDQASDVLVVESKMFLSLLTIILGALIQFCGSEQ